MNALLALYCVMLCNVCVVVLVCSLNVLMRVVFDVLCDVLWLASFCVLCGWMFMFNRFVCARL